MTGGYAQLASSYCPDAYLLKFCRSCNQYTTHFFTLITFRSPCGSRTHTSSRTLEPKPSVSAIFTKEP